MAFSVHNYVGDGTDRQLAVNFTLGFLSRDDVQAQVDGEGSLRTITWINDGLITIGSVGVGVGIEIRRVTTKTALQHDFSDGSVVGEQELDEGNLQTIMLVHEILDGFRDPSFTHRNDEDYGGFKITNLGDPDDLQDAATKFYVDNIVNLTGDIDSAVLAAENARDAAIVAQGLSEDAATASDLSRAAAVVAQVAAEAAQLAATTQAGIATAQAGIATTKADESSASAAAALVSENNADQHLTDFEANYRGASATEPTSPVTGQLYTDTSVSPAVLMYYNGVAWIKAGSAVEGIVVTKTAVGTAGSTVVTVDYNVGQVLVFIGGFMTTDITATSGTSITVNNTLAGDEILIMTYGSFVSADHYTKAESDARRTPLFKNMLLNGGFTISQRGSSFTTRNAYGLDRWYIADIGTAVVVSPQTATPPIGSYGYCRCESAVAGSKVIISQTLPSETVETIQGRWVTFSCKLRASAAAGTRITTVVRKSAVKNSRGGMSDISTILTASASIPTGTTRNDWIKMEQSVLIPDDGTAEGLQIQIYNTDGMAVGEYYEIADAQLEAATEASDFEVRSITDERLLCSRFYQKSYDEGTAIGTSTPSGGVQVYFNGISSISNRVTYANVRLPVETRIVPVITIYSGYGLANTISSLGNEETAVVNSEGTKGFSTYCIGSGTSTAVDMLFHWTVDAEI